MDNFTTIFVSVVGLIMLYMVTQSLGKIYNLLDDIHSMLEDMSGRSADREAEIDAKIWGGADRKKKS